MTTYNVIEQLCNENDIAITALEKELGFGRGSIGKLKKGGSMSHKRLQVVADYFNVSIDFLVNGTPLEKKEVRVNMKNELENILKSLDNNTGLYPSGKLPESDIEKEALANSIKIVMATIDSFDNK